MLQLGECMERVVPVLDLLLELAQIFFALDLIDRQLNFFTVLR
jgi:hypothetical protein